MKPVILIPAYKPDIKTLSDIVHKVASSDVQKIIVVDDGSGPDYKEAFGDIGSLENVIVLCHSTNLGRGAALRTGFNHVLQYRLDCPCVVTVGADGQHLPEDVDKIIQSANTNPDALILGCREFKGKIPLKSFLGNKITYLMFRGLAGKSISDTQTGLRAIPISLVKQLTDLSSDRYAYELEMLLTLVHKQVEINEVSIETIYEDNNSVSSFRPITDSFLVYKTLFRWWFAFRFKELCRYSLSGIFSTIADFGTYMILINFSCGFITASVFARLLSVIIHFLANKYFTFSYNTAPSLWEVAKYLMVVAFNLSSSILLIYLFMEYFNAGEVLAKVIAQMLLFLFTYALLNGFVFLRSKKQSNG